MSWGACLFLAGRPLARRSLSWNGVQGPCIELRYGASAAGASAAGASVDDVLPAHTSWVGYADGARSMQPLARAAAAGSELRDGAGADARRVVWCGDADSIEQGELRTMMSGASDVTECVHLPRDKSVSDGAVLMERCRSDAPTGTTLVVDIIGALGGRRDHEIVNLAELGHVFFGRGPAPDSRAAVPPPGPCVVVIQPSLILANVAVSLGGVPHGMPVTVLVSQPPSPLNLSGLRYSGTFVLERPSQGLSNVVVDDLVRLEPMPAAAEGPWRRHGAFFTVVIGHDESCFFV